MRGVSRSPWRTARRLVARRGRSSRGSPLRWSRLEREAREAVHEGAGSCGLRRGVGASPRRDPDPARRRCGSPRAHQAGTAQPNSRIVALADDARDAHHVACLTGTGAAGSRSRGSRRRRSANSPRNDGSPTSFPGRGRAAVPNRARGGRAQGDGPAGDSTVDAYHGAMAFDALGLDEELADPYVSGWRVPRAASDQMRSLKRCSPGTIGHGPTRLSRSSTTRG